MRQLARNANIAAARTSIASTNPLQDPTGSKTFSPSPAIAGDSTRLSIVLTNNDAQALTGLSVQDSLPTGLAVYTAPSASTTCAGGVVSATPGSSNFRLTGATVPPNASCTFQADVVASAAGSLTNTIGADAIDNDQGLSNPMPADAVLDVTAPPTISKAPNPAAIAVSGVSTLTVALGNSNVAAISLTSELVDALPGNVLIAATPNIVSSCPGVVTAVAGAIQFSYANGSVIPAAGCSISVDVNSNVAGSNVNTIAARQLTTSSGNNPEAAVATLGVGGVSAAPTIDRAFSPDTIDVDGISTLTLTLNNPNTTLLTLASDFTDNLPANVLIANRNNLAGSCTLGSVTATPGTSDLRYVPGAQIPAGGCTISVSVSSSVAGSHNNSIAAGDLNSTEGGGPNR